MSEKAERDSTTEKLVWTAATINAGLGVVPLGINVWTFVRVNTALIMALGSLYGFHISHEKAARLIRHIFTSAGATFLVLTLGTKVFAEVLKGVGVLAMGGPTLAGIALDGMLCGVVTYALGFTAKDHFQMNTQMSKEEVRERFKGLLTEGMARVQDQADRQAATWTRIADDK